MSAVIKVENLSKVYQLGQFTTGTLSADISRWWALKRGKEDPFLKIGETNDRAVKGSSDIVWSLQDINFEIEQGSAVGIIGKNGAGKSTLLKVLSQITSPTTGSIKVKGRIASLLEVGTGFHPELTGRENIFLNGAILGMRKKEIARKFEEIVDFAGVERYIDTPVKRYSSGMYVRLAFAVAAHLESEILIVDEVLAVGDAEFQKKCLGKMGDISKGDGRTILFVSHNLAAIQQLCQKGIVLSNGQLECVGSSNEAVDHYINMSDKISYYLEDGFLGLEHSREKLYKAKVFAKIRVLDNKNKPRESFPMLSSMKIEIELANTDEYPGMDYGISIANSTGQLITSYATWMLKEKINTPKRIVLDIPKINFSAGSYRVSLSMTHPKEGAYIDKIENAIGFNVESIDIFSTGRNFDSDYGLVLPDGHLMLL
jgi:lipopolysaccharide transport system ATP-binding protein